MNIHPGSVASGIFLLKHGALYAFLCRRADGSAYLRLLMQKLRPLFRPAMRAAIPPRLFFLFAYGRTDRPRPFRSFSRCRPDLPPLHDFLLPGRRCPEKCTHVRSFDHASSSCGKAAKFPSPTAARQKGHDAQAQQEKQRAEPGKRHGSPFPCVPTETSLPAFRVTTAETSEVCSAAGRTNTHVMKKTHGMQQS